MTIVKDVETDEEVVSEIGKETELTEIADELKALMSLLFGLADAE